MSKKVSRTFFDFRGGMDTFTHPEKLRGSSTARFAEQCSLRFGRVQSRRPWFGVATSDGSETVQGLFETVYNSSTYTFHVTDVGLYLNGSKISTTVKGYCKPFRHRNSVYFMNSNSYRKYDLETSTLVDVGLAAVADNCAAPARKPGPNSLLIMGCEEANGVGAAGDRYAESFPYGSLATAPIEHEAGGGTAVGEAFEGVTGGAPAPFQGTKAIYMSPTDGELADRHGIRVSLIGRSAGATTFGFGSTFSTNNNEWGDLPDTHKIGALLVWSDFPIDARSLQYSIFFGTADNGLDNYSKPEQFNTVINSDTWNYMRIDWPADGLEAEIGSLGGNLNSIAIVNDSGETANKEVYTMGIDCVVGHTFMKGGYNNNTTLPRISDFKRDGDSTNQKNCYQDILPIGPLDGEYYYAVTAVDAYGLESQAGRIDFKSIREAPKVAQTFDPDNPERNANIDETEDVLVPLIANNNSAVLRVKGTVLEDYITANPTVDHFRVYRLGGTSTGWKYVGKWELTNVLPNVRSVTFSGGGGTASGGPDVLKADAQGSNAVLSGSTSVVDVRIVDKTLSPPVYGVRVNGGTWSHQLGTPVTYDCTNQWHQLDYDGTPLGIWIRFSNLTDAASWKDVVNDATGATYWTITVENNDEYPFFDDFRDDELTVLGTWQSNATPQDRLSDTLFYDDTNARLYIGYGKYLYYSESNYPDNVPYLNFLQFPSDIMAISRDSLGILVKTRYNSYRLGGDPGTYTADLVANGVGAVSPFASAVVRGYDFTYSSGRVTTIDTTKAFVAKSQAQEIDVGMKLYGTLPQSDPNAFAEFDHLNGEYILITTEGTFMGQIDNLPNVEYTKLQSDQAITVAHYSKDTHRLIVGKSDGTVNIYQGGPLATPDDFSTYTWRSREMSFGDDQAFKDAMGGWARYYGNLTLKIYKREPGTESSTLLDTYVLPDHDTLGGAVEFKRFAQQLRGQLLQIEAVGEGLLYYLRMDAYVLDGDSVKQPQQQLPQGG